MSKLKRVKSFPELLVKATFFTQTHRRVKIRLSRTLLYGMNDKLKIKSDGSDKYLTMPYRRPFHAQIDLEARADQNRLVFDG